MRAAGHYWNGMAIQMALMGGIGIIHYNNSIEEQANMIRAVKRYENGFILNPVVVHEKETIGNVIEMSKQLGFSGFPVTDTGELYGPIGRDSHEAGFRFRFRTSPRRSLK